VDFVDLVEVVDRVQIGSEDIDQLRAVFTWLRPPLAGDPTERDSLDAHAFKPARGEQTDQAVSSASVADDHSGFGLVCEVL